MSDKPLKQKGFTLIELVVAMIVGGMIVSAVATGIVQLIKVNAFSSDSALAYTNVQNAGYWISHDTVQAQEVSITEGFPTLKWVGWENDTHQVVYTLKDTGELMRSYSINGSIPENIVVARYIVPGKPMCSFDGRVLTLEIQAKVGDRSATRTYKVETRPFP
ncbi:MAG: prepilin-type N-terminal cleavage/methylation domain-containing protein [Dehalococcoidia bacterium]|nr:prepilin-type N-terminal cleavage/methylation domain-containing protein [Dehalococcoidia bacterium]